MFEMSKEHNKIRLNELNSRIYKNEGLNWFKFLKMD